MERQAEKWMNLCLSVPDLRDWRQFWGTSDRFRGISLPVGLGGGINKTILTKNKKATPPKGCFYNNKAHQRRVIRVSEMFAEHRSSGDARSDRREWPACPWGLSR